MLLARQGGSRGLLLNMSAQTSVRFISKNRLSSKSDPYDYV